MQTLHNVLKLMTHSRCLTWCAIVCSTSSQSNLSYFGTSLNAMDLLCVSCMPSFGSWLQLPEGEVAGGGKCLLSYSFHISKSWFILCVFNHHDVKDVVSVSLFCRTNWGHGKYLFEALPTVQ